MNSKPRDVLVEVLATFGPALLSSPARFEGVLKDYCGEFRREIFVLVSCLRVGVVEQLRQQTGSTVKLACARLALKLEQNLAISAEAAKWGVESWAIALGLLDPLGETGVIKAIPHAEPALVSASVSYGSPMAETQKLGDLKEAIPSFPSQPVIVQEAEYVAPVEEPEMVVEEKAPPEYLSQEPEPRSLQPDWANPVAQVIVYPESSGKKPNLRDAVRDASATTCLLLRPGVYKESVVIKKDLQIRGDGELGQVIIESLTASTVTLDGASLLLTGLTIKGVSGKDKKAMAAVEVRAGHLIMEDCDLTSDSSSIVEVKGEKSMAILRRCHLHDGKAGGIIFQDGAAGYLEECHLYQNKLSHVVIGKGCSPTLFSCKISNALMAGIYVNEGGNGLIENCDIWGNSVAGVQCRRGGNPRVRYCRISGSERYGVLVAEQGEGWFEECLIFENNKAGVTIGQQSKPRFNSCHVSDNHGVGIEIHEKSSGEFFDCEIFGNEDANIAVKDQSDPEFSRCVIHEGQQEGVVITVGAKGRFTDCQFLSNAKAGVLVNHNAAPIFQGCIFHSGLESGLTFLNGAEGQFTNCEFSDHNGTAIIVGERSQPRFEGCRITKNLAIGIHVDSAGAPYFRNCAITQNQAIGFLCTNSSPKVIDGEISGNIGGGLQISAQGKGRWENVSMIANMGDAVLVTEAARPVLKQCRIDRSEKAGIHFSNQAQGTVEDVEIKASGGPGVEVDGGTNPALRKVRVLNGQGIGILVHPLGGGSADHCDVRDNEGGNWDISPTARLARVAC